MSESRNFENDQDRINLYLIHIHFLFNYKLPVSLKTNPAFYFRLLSI